MSRPVLHLTAAHVRESLFRGGFAPMKETDFWAYADAPKGSLIAEIRVGRHLYTALFDPTTGEVEVHFFEPNGDSYGWLMDCLTGNTVEL